MVKPNTTRYEDRELVRACCEGRRADMAVILTKKTPRNKSIKLMCDCAIANSGLTEEIITRARHAVYNRFVKELDVNFADVLPKAENRYYTYIKANLTEKADALYAKIQDYRNNGRLF